MVSMGVRNFPLMKSEKIFDLIGSTLTYPISLVSSVTSSNILSS